MRHRLKKKIFVEFHTLVIDRWFEIAESKYKNKNVLLENEPLDCIDYLMEMRYLKSVDVVDKWLKDWE